LRIKIRKTFEKTVKKLVEVIKNRWGSIFPDFTQQKCGRHDPPPVASINMSQFGGATGGGGGWGDDGDGRWFV